MKTTLYRIRGHEPCYNGWQKLLRNLGKTQADDEPLSITAILESNGLDDALWCLRAVDGHDREMRLLAVEYARSAQHLMKDPRSLAALDVAERYAYGLVNRKKLTAAHTGAKIASNNLLWEGSACVAEASTTASSVVLDWAFDAARLAAFKAANALAWEVSDKESNENKRIVIYDKTKAKVDEMFSDLLRIFCAQVEL